MEQYSSFNQRAANLSFLIADEVHSLLDGQLPPRRRLQKRVLYLCQLGFVVSCTGSCTGQRPATGSCTGKRPATASGGVQPVQGKRRRGSNPPP
jgi:hypothetical protein